MFTRVMSVALIVALAGTLTPAWSENLVNPKLLASLSPAASRPMPAYRWDAPASQAASTQQGQRGSWTTAGKVLFWVGIGLMASGAGELAFAQTLKDKSYCSGTGYYRVCTTEDYSLPRAVWRAGGIGSIATGAVLTAVGLSRRD